jgi:PD-(D/E)XK nuclease superfamily
MHSECPERARLTWDGRKSPVADVRVFFRGNVADRAMRRWLQQDDPQPGQMAAWIDEVLADTEQEVISEGDGIVRWRSATDRHEVREWCLALVQRLEPILYRIVVPLDYEPAKRFKAPIKVQCPHGNMCQVLLTGEFDVLTRDSGGDFRVWDLKATEDNSYWRKTAGQLVTYDLACRLLYGKFPVRTGLIQPMCTQPVLEFAWTDEHRRVLASRISATALEIWGKQCKPRPGHQCYDCNVKHACPLYGNVSVSATGTRRVAV